MAPSLDTSPLSDAEILHLLRTLAPGIPPGLTQPPLSPDPWTPPWVARPRPARSPLRGLTLAAGALGLLVLWGLAHPAGGSGPPPGPAAFATPVPVAVYWAHPAATALPPTPAPPPVLPGWTPTPAPALPPAGATAVPPTLPPAVPTTAAPPTLPPPAVPTAAPPALPPPTAASPMLPPPPATPVPASAPPPPPPPTGTPVLPTVPPPGTPELPTVTPPPDPPSAPSAIPQSAFRTPPSAGGSGAWGNDWLDPAIQAREATALAVPTPEAP